MFSAMGNFFEEVSGFGEEGEGFGSSFDGAGLDAVGSEGEAIAGEVIEEGAIKLELFLGFEGEEGGSPLSEGTEGSFEAELREVEVMGERGMEEECAEEVVGDEVEEEFDLDEAW